jgi:sugar lactone lactonase YvrE
VIEVLVDGLDHPEGVCWDPVAGVVWAGGEAGQVYRVDFDERRAEEVARAPGFLLVLAVDGRGRVVLCCRDAGSLCVLDDGTVRTLLAAPTNIAFAGPNLDRLVCANLGRWHLALVESGLRGAPVHYPTRWAVDA